MHYRHPADAPGSSSSVWRRCVVWRHRCSAACRPRCLGPCPCVDREPGLARFFCRLSAHTVNRPSMVSRIGAISDSRSVRARSCRQAADADSENCLRHAARLRDLVSECLPGLRCVEQLCEPVGVQAQIAWRVRSACCRRRVERQKVVARWMASIIGASASLSSRRAAITARHAGQVLRRGRHHARNRN